MAIRIEVGQIVVGRESGKASLVLDVSGADAHIVGISRLERAHPEDPTDGRWAPFVPAKEAVRGWIPVARLLAETF